MNLKVGATTISFLFLSFYGCQVDDIWRSAEPFEHVEHIEKNLPFEGCSAPLSANTVNGSIMSLWNTRLRCSTVFQRKHALRLPPDASLELDLGVVNGSIRCDIPLTVKGEISKKSLRGRINDGGPMVKMGTVNGSINITAA